jgi:hypothetical protein
MGAVEQIVLLADLFVPASVERVVRADRPAPDIVVDASTAGVGVSVGLFVDLQCAPDDHSAFLS